MIQSHTILGRLFLCSAALALTEVPAIAQGVPTQPAPAQPPAAAPAKTLVNTTSVSLEYRVDRVGPSGIAKVEVWITPDQGTTWRKLSEETPRQGPFQFVLPGEGLYGVRLVGVNGNGFGGTPPRRGDTPSFWVEVDATPPLVQLGNIDAYTDGANLTICWTAQDRNLRQAPISLLYRSEADTAWQVIARNIKNSGQHRWQFPRDKGDRLYFRVEAADETGNSSFAETPTPVVLDTVEPQLLVIGVTAGEPCTAKRIPAVLPQGTPPASQPIQQTGATLDPQNALPPASPPPALLPSGAGVIVDNQ